VRSTLLQIIAFILAMPLMSFAEQNKPLNYLTCAMAFYGHEAVYPVKSLNSRELGKQILSYNNLNLKSGKNAPVALIPSTRDGGLSHV